MEAANENGERLPSRPSCLRFQVKHIEAELRREVLLSFGEPNATFRVERWHFPDNLVDRMALVFLCEGEAERVVTLSPKYAEQVAALLSEYPY